MAYAQLATSVDVNRSFNKKRAIQEGFITLFVMTAAPNLSWLAIATKPQVRKRVE